MVAAASGSNRRYTAQETRHRIFSLVAASSGNLVECFDFYGYAFTALYFAPAFFPKSHPTAQLLNTAGMFAAGFLMRPIGGWLFGRIADRKGRKISMVISVTMMCGGSLLFGALGTLGTVGTVRIMMTLHNVTNPYVAFFLIIPALAIVSFYTSISGIVNAEMFPPEVRALGVGLAYAIANAIFGGSAEYVALGLKSVGHESAFFWYVTAMMVIAFLVAFRLPNQPKYLHDDH